jgi:hypothetical protein
VRRGASPTRRTFQPEATGAVMEVTKWLCLRCSRSRIGYKPAPAPKRTSQSPCNKAAAPRRSMEFLRKETLLGIARPSALHYGAGGARGSPPERPTIEGSVSSRDVDEIRKSPNPGTPGDAKLSNCMSST